MFEEFLKLSTLAHEEESKRRTILEVKTDYLFKWLTFVITIVGIAVPIIAKQINIDFNDKFVIIGYVGTMICFISAIISVIAINFPRKTKLNILGTEMMKIVKDNALTDTREVIYREILLKDYITKELRRENERKARLIMFCSICLVIGMLFMAFLFSYFVWGV